MGELEAPVLPSPFPGWHTDTYPAIDPSRPELSLKGKSAIVSGGGGTIGSAHVNALAKAGAAVVGIVGRTQKTLDETKAKYESAYPNTQFIAVVGDVISFSSLESAFKQIRQHTNKPIDLLVHNAGFLAQPATITSSDPKEWWTAFETNILGAFNSVRAFLPVASPTATIVDINTAASHFPTAAIENLSAYSASKLAALKVFEFLQVENPDLRVFNVQPGVILSDMNVKHGAFPPMDTGKADFVLLLLHKNGIVRPPDPVHTSGAHKRAALTGFNMKRRSVSLVHSVALQP